MQVNQASLLEPQNRSIQKNQLPPPKTGKGVQVSRIEDSGLPGIDKSIGQSSLISSRVRISKVDQSIDLQSLSSKSTNCVSRGVQSFVCTYDAFIQCDLIDWSQFPQKKEMKSKGVGAMRLKLVDHGNSIQYSLSSQSGQSVRDNSLVDRSLSAISQLYLMREAKPLMRDETTSARLEVRAEQRSEALSAYNPPSVQNSVRSQALSARVPSVKSEGISPMKQKPALPSRTPIYGGNLNDQLQTASDVNPLLSDVEEIRPKVTPYIKKTKATIVYKEEPVIKESSFESQQLQYDRQKFPMKSRHKMLEQKGQVGRNSESLVIQTPRDFDNQALKVYQPCLIQAQEDHHSFIVYDLKKRVIKRFKTKYYFYKHFGIAQLKAAALVAGGIDSKNLITVAYTHRIRLSGQVDECEMMSVPRADLALAAGGVEKQLVYATGGWSNNMLCNTEVYSCVTEIWTSLPALLQPRAAHASCVFNTPVGITVKSKKKNPFVESLYVFCGVSREKNLASIEMLNLERATSWKQIKVDCDINFWQPRSHLQAVQINDKEMVVFGSHQPSKVTFLVQPLGGSVVVSSASQSEQKVPATCYRRVSTVIRNKVAIVTENYELWFFSKGEWKSCVV